MSEQIAYDAQPRKPGGYPEWTYERFVAARELFLSGVDPEIIARRVGVINGASVYGKMRKQGVVRERPGGKSTHHWTRDREELLTKLWAEGLTATQVAAEMGGITRNMVIGKVHRLKLPPREPRVNPVTRGRRAGARRVRARIPVFPAFEGAPTQTTIPPVEYVCIGIEDLREHHCRYPIGGYDKPIMFCGNQKMENSPYCVYCHSVCHRS